MGNNTMNTKISKKILPLDDLTQKLFNVNNLFRIKAIAYSQQKYEVEESGNIKAGESSKKLADFEFIYNQQSLPIVHNHKFEGDYLSKITSQINEVQSAVAGINESTLTEAIQKWTTNGGKEDKPSYSRAAYFNAYDIIPIYKGTTPPEITISFMLFAYDDPIKEVIIPCQYLTYLTYPKNGTKANTCQPDTLFNSMNEPVSFYTEADKDENAREINNDASAEKMTIIRRFSAEQPPRWKIITTNNTFALQNCHCSSIQVTYYGPWIGRPEVSKEQGEFFKLVSESFRGIGGSLGNAAKQIISKSINGGDKPMGNVSTSSGLPSYAEVQMKFTSNFSYLYGEEWLLNSSPNGKTTIIQMMQQKGKRIPTGGSPHIGLYDEETKPNKTSYEIAKEDDASEYKVQQRKKFKDNITAIKQGEPIAGTGKVTSPTIYGIPLNEEDANELQKLQRDATRANSTLAMSKSGAMSKGGTPSNFATDTIGAPRPALNQPQPSVLTEEQMLPSYLRTPTETNTSATMDANQELGIYSAVDYPTTSLRDAPEIASPPVPTSSTPTRTSTRRSARGDDAGFEFLRPIPTNPNE